MPYQHKYSNFLREEIKRLEVGNADQQKRARKIHDQISAVLLDPHNAKYHQRTLPERYCAVEVGERFRLFFEIIERDKKVFFVWINGEDFLHRTGDANDCYVEFRRLVANGDIEEYVSNEVIDTEFRMSTNWGAHQIYACYTLIRETIKNRADCDLLLSQVDEKSYKIRSISVDQEGIGLACGLLDRLIGSAAQNRIELYVELLKLPNSSFEKNHHILTKFGFEKTLEDDEFELWVRKPN